MKAVTDVKTNGKYCKKVAMVLDGFGVFIMIMNVQSLTLH